MLKIYGSNCNQDIALSQKLIIDYHGEISTKQFFIQFNDYQQEKNSYKSNRFVGQTDQLLKSNSFSKINEKFKSQQTSTSLKNSVFSKISLKNDTNNSTIQKLEFLQKKGSKLIQKVLSIQKQIQSYAQVQQKQMKFFNYDSLNRNFQYIKKMNILGKSKVKMIESLQNQIQNLKHKTFHQNQQQKQTIDIQGQINQKFNNYYSHQRDILKQSKSQKFQYRSFKLNQKNQCQNKYIQRYDKTVQDKTLQYKTVQDKTSQVINPQTDNQQSSQAKLKLITQQFDRYKQRSNEQHQYYKQKLNQSKTQKTQLLKIMYKLKFQYLQEKILNRNKKGIITKRQNTSRNSILEQTQVTNNESQIDINLSQFKLQFNLSKTDRNKNGQVDLEDLQQFKDDLRMRFVQQNYQIQQQINEIQKQNSLIQEQNNQIQEQVFVIQQLQQQISQLKTINSQFQQNLTQLSQSVQSLQCLIQNKNDLLSQLQQEKQQKINYIIQLVQQMHDMNKYIQQMKQNYDRKEYQISQLQLQINKASIINNQYQKKIIYLVKQNKQLSDFIETQTQKDKQILFDITFDNQSTRISTFQHQEQKQISTQQYQSLLSILHQKSLQVQQLELELLNLDQKVNQRVSSQVEEAIRTYLRYRRHINNIDHLVFNIIIESQINHSQHSTDQQTKFVLNYPTIIKNDWILRNFIDKMITIKFNSVQQTQQIHFKIHLCLQLVDLAIRLLTSVTQQDTNESFKHSKSISKKLPSLLLQEIQIVSDDNFQSKDYNYFRKNIKNCHFSMNQNEEKQKDEQKQDKSLIYVSPQVLLSMNQSENTYCWTLGIMIHQVFHHKLCFNKVDEIISRKQNYLYVNSMKYQESFSIKLQNLLQRMLKKNHKERPKLLQVKLSLLDLLNNQ